MAVLQSDGVNHTSDLILRRNGTEGLRLTSSTVQLSSINDGPISGARNRIINGDMRIDQRNAGASVNVTTVDAYCVDRWTSRGMTGTGHTIQRVSDAPVGFTNSLQFTVGTGASPDANDRNNIFQIVEGFNFADLDFGASSAKQVTLSFWVKTSVSGTFGGALTNGDTTRCFPFTYTVNSPNTWEYKTLSIEGDTTGTWGKTNDRGAFVWLDLGAGTNRQGPAGTWASTDYRTSTGCTQIITTTGATFQITGVQLEPGPVATPFERRPIGTELALCQRYYQTIEIRGRRGGGYFTRNNNRSQGRWSFPVYMRVPPTFTQTRIFGDGTWSSAVISANNGWIEAERIYGIDMEVNVDIDAGGGNGGTFRFILEANSEL